MFHVLKWIINLGLGSVVTSTYGIHLRLSTVVGQDDIRGTSRQFDGLPHSLETVARRRNSDTLRRTLVPILARRQSPSERLQSPLMRLLPTLGGFPLYATRKREKGFISARLMPGCVCVPTFPATYISPTSSIRFLEANSSSSKSIKPISPATIRRGPTQLDYV